MSKMVKAVVLIGIAGVVLAGCVIDCSCNQQNAKAKRVQDFSMEPAKVFEASTENGSIEALGWAEAVCKVTAAVEVRAASQDKADEYLQKVQVRFERSGDILKAVVNRDEVPKDVEVSVSYKVLTPVGTELNLSSVNGSLKTSGIAGAVKANTVNGSIAADSQAGDISASTVNGSLKLSFTPDAKVNAITGYTVNGSASVKVPNSFAGAVKLETVNGGINSDVPLTVKGKLGKNVDGMIGTGTGRLELSTVNGAIRLY